MKTVIDILAKIEASPAKDSVDALAFLIALRLLSQPNLNLLDALRVVSILHLPHEYDTKAALALFRLEAAGLTRFYVKDGAFLSSLDAIQNIPHDPAIRVVWALCEEDALKDSPL